MTAAACGESPTQWPLHEHYYRESASVLHGCLLAIRIKDVSNRIQSFVFVPASAVPDIYNTRRMPVQRAALSGMKNPTRESPARDAASPISTTNLVAITVAPSTGRQ